MEQHQSQRRRVGASLVGVGLALGASVFAGAPAGADGTLVLLPALGHIGDTVLAEQPVVLCDTYRLRWTDAAGPLLGTDSGADGRGTVTFRVPDSDPVSHAVVATCQASPAAPELVVGLVPFLVTTGSSSSTVVTTTSLPGGATSVPRTTVAPATTVGTRPPATAPTVTTRGTGTTATSPTTSRSAAPATTLGLPKNVADCERQLRKASSRLVYAPNRRMTVGVPTDVVAKLALDAPDVTAAVLPSPDRTTIVELHILRCTVDVTLAGDGFTVTPPGAIGQSFVDSRVLTFSWQVTPTRAGAGLKLGLHLLPRVIESGQPTRPGSEELHEAVIDVTAVPQPVLHIVDDKVNGFFANPLAKLLLIPGGGGLISVWAGRRLRRRPTP